MILENTLPTTPGCYLFKDSENKVIYIGEAKNIRKRVKSYFHHTDLDPKTQSLVNHITSVDFIATDTEVEALILENTLIKQHQPKYNIRLRDAKSYAYILLTKETFPRICIARGKTAQGTRYGPFVSAQERDYLLWFLRKTFLLRTCKRMPKKPCLRYHIHLCDAPCAGLISQEKYQERIKKVHLLLSGRDAQAVQQLKKEMKEASRNLLFEQALQLREQITAIEHLQERQNMQRQRTYNEDIMNFLVHNEVVYLLLFNIYKGTLTNKNEFVFGYHEDFFEEFLVQYYSDHELPAEIIIPRRLSTSLSAFLNEKRKKLVKVTVSQRGAKKQLLDLVLKNIEITFFADSQKVEELQKKLKLYEPPLVIECFDISHLSGTSTVGSMVQFRNGKPDKSNYRRFRIRTVEGIDDVGAIAEVIRRRYRRLVREEADLPHLLIIDGGRGQLNAALHQLGHLGLHLPVVAIAKQFEELYLPGRSRPLRLDKKDKALQFIQEMRNEAHRFAISYNRLLRKKELIP
jgi:excinuclease ABC subunit C